MKEIRIQNYSLINAEYEIEDILSIDSTKISRVVPHLKHEKTRYKDPSKAVAFRFEERFSSPRLRFHQKWLNQS